MFMTFYRTILILPAATILVAAAIGSGACGSSGGDGGLFSLPPGAKGTSSFGACTTSNGYATASASYCASAGLACPGMCYALCDGTKYMGLSCTAPSGFTGITTPPDFSGFDGGSVGDAAPLDTGAVDGGPAGEGGSGDTGPASEAGSVDGGSASDAATTG